MKIKPYFIFKGNAKEAIELYEKAFNAKATVLPFSQMPNFKGTEAEGNLVMHAEISYAAGEAIYLSDNMRDEVIFGNSVSLAVEFDNQDLITNVFNIFKDNGGKVLMPLEKNFFSPCYGQIVDKFGIKWQLRVIQ